MRILLALLLLSLPLAARGNDWDAVYERSTTVALSGAVPAGALSLVGVAGSTTLLVPQEHLAEEVHDGAMMLGMVAGYASPISLVGTGLLAGGGLRARRALVEQGAEVGAAGGTAAWALAGAAVALGGAGLGLEQPALLTAASWTLLGAQAAGYVQLAANYRARSTLGERTWEDRYEQGRTAYRSGLVTLGLGVGSAVVGTGLVYLYAHAVDRARGLVKVLIAVAMIPVAAAGMAGALFGVGAIALGPGIMSTGALRARGALVERGQGVTPVAGWTSLGLLIASAPVAVAGALVDEQALFVVTGGMWLAAIGLAMVQMEQNRGRYVDVEGVDPFLRVDLPPLRVRF